MQSLLCLVVGTARDDAREDLKKEKELHEQVRANAMTVVVNENTACCGGVRRVCATRACVCVCVCVCVACVCVCCA